MRLQGALNNEVLVAVQKFLSDGVPADVDTLYTAFQRSNSSLKRRPKKVLQSSIEKVLESLGTGQEEDELDSDAVIEDNQPEPEPEDIMNKSLRANLAPRPTTAPSSPPAATNGDEAYIKKRKSNGESMPKRQKRDQEQITTKPPTNLSLADIGGMDDVIEQMNALILVPLGMPDANEAAQISDSSGILLHGPPGCGKTMLARAYASILGMPFIEILGPSIVSGMSGESEKGIRDRFEEAKKNAPCLIFIDEIDAIAPKRESSQSQMEKRIVAQLLVSMDEIHSEISNPVIVLAATNRPDSIDPALRRGGRFGTEITINVPNEVARERILKTQTSAMTLSHDVDFAKLAKMTAGFVGADLRDLVKKAAAHMKEDFRKALLAQAISVGLGEQFSTCASSAARAGMILAARLKRKDLPKPPGFETFTLAMSDFLAVLPGITPSSKREGFMTTPDVSWKDIGALQSVREQLQSAIIDPIDNAKLFEALGRTTPSGILLWGPPGCGKTLLAKAVASESKANFISINGPELLNKFVGESEAAVRKVFQRARSSVPCIIFFDEFDALVPRRDGGGSEVSVRVVNTLLTELDGLGNRASIYAIAATNRPDMIDPALLRAGRFGTQLFVDMPGEDERVSILRALTARKPVQLTAEIEEIARTSHGYSGADLGALVDEAITSAFKRRSAVIELQDFVWASSRVRGSVRDMEFYHQLEENFGQR